MFKKMMQVVAAVGVSVTLYAENHYDDETNYYITAMSAGSTGNTYVYFSRDNIVENPKLCSKTTGYGLSMDHPNYFPIFNLLTEAMEHGYKVRFAIDDTKCTNSYPTIGWLKTFKN